MGGGEGGVFGPFSDYTKPFPCQGSYTIGLFGHIAAVPENQRVVYGSRVGRESKLQPTKENEQATVMDYLMIRNGRLPQKFYDEECGDY